MTPSGWQIGTSELAPVEAFSLVGDADPAGRAIERARERGAGLLGRIVLLRQMRGNHVAQPRRVDRGQKLRRRLVVQMAEAARDALLELPWIVAAGEHVEVVVALEHQSVAAGKARLHVRRDDADVGQHPELARAVADDELDGLARVVWNRERTHFDGVDAERVVAVEPAHLLDALESVADRLQRPERQPDRNPVARSECRDATRVVGMLVRDQDRPDRLGRETKAREARNRVAHPKAAIDQDAGAVRFDDEAIAFAATAE